MTLHWTACCQYREAIGELGPDAWTPRRCSCASITQSMTGWAKAAQDNRAQEARRWQTIGAPRLCEIHALVQQRHEARMMQHYEEADRYSRQLDGRDVSVTDTPTRTTWRWGLIYTGEVGHVSL